MKTDSVLRRACCRWGAVLYNYRGSITGESANGENLGVRMLLTFPEKVFSPPRTYLLMLVVMMGCQQRDKVLSVNHGPLQWSRSIDAWPWWTLGCNRETKRDREKKILNRFKYQKSAIYFHRKALVASRIQVCWWWHTESGVTRADFSTAAHFMLVLSVIDAGILGAQVSSTVDLWNKLMNAYVHLCVKSCF